MIFGESRNRGSLNLPHGSVGWFRSFLKAELTRHLRRAARAELHTEGRCRKDLTDPHTGRVGIVQILSVEQRLYQTPRAQRAGDEKAVPAKIRT